MRMSVAEPTGDTEPTVGGVTSMFVITLAVYAPPAVAAMVSRTSGSSLLLSGPPYHSGRKLVCAISWTRALIAPGTSAGTLPSSGVTRTA